MARLYIDQTTAKEKSEGVKGKASSVDSAVQTKAQVGAAGLGGAFFGREAMGHLGTAHSMPGPVQAKMEGALGADFSGVELYESSVVSDGGALAAASGNKVAFAPGKMNFGTSAGLELLGHELSHVASQARGEVGGCGLVNNSALEHKADMDGKKAASFSAFDSASGQTLTPMSSGMSGMSASAPIQAKKPGKSFTRGEMLQRDFEKADMGGKVDLLAQYARLGSHTNELDEGENDTYFRLLGQMGPEFMDTLLQKEVAASQAVNQVAENEGGYGFEDYGNMVAQNSEEAARFQAYQTLALNMGMGGNEAAYGHFREQMVALQRSDPSAAKSLNDANGILTDAHRSAWATDPKNHVAVDALTRGADVREGKFAESWHADRTRKTEKANNNIFMRLFGHVKKKR